jgi:hypothetical protein
LHDPLLGALVPVDVLVASLTPRPRVLQVLCVRARSKIVAEIVEAVAVDVIDALAALGDDQSVKVDVRLTLAGPLASDVVNF